jgi:predicted Zn-dependent protease
MAQAGSSPPEFLSTHPSGETRIKQLQERIPKAKIAYQNAVNQGQRPACKL